MITYNLSVKNAKAIRLPDGHGRYEVTFTVIAQRFENQKDGSEKEIGINEPVVIGLFSKHPSDLRKGEKPLYLQAHQVSGKETFIRLIVKEKPGFVGIDVFGGRVDGDLGDNVSAL